MQRDMKVGMALGVALVGIVGALFFRRDPAPPAASPPPLQGGAELDKQIAEKGKAPYIQGLDEFPEPAPAPPSPTATKSTTAKPNGKPNAYEVPGFLTKQDEAEHRAFLSSKQPAAPDPISTAVVRESRTTPNSTPASEPPPAHNRDWEPAGPPAARPISPSRSTAEGVVPGASRRTHVTQPGETLSGLAANYLGSSARYREIYEANRNVLRSPDDIPDGVTLVIPDLGKPTGTHVKTNHNHTAEPGLAPKIRRTSTQMQPQNPAAQPVPEPKTPAVSGEYSSGKLRFAPVTRGPFSAGRTPAPPRATPGSADPSPRPESKPSHPRIELDDEPF